LAGRRGTAHLSISRYTQKTLFGNQGKVLNLGHLDFDIVSNFVLRISYFSYRDTLHEIRNALYIRREPSTNQPIFIQNKPNFPDDQMNVSGTITKDYENKSNYKLRENKANTKPLKPNLLDTQMNVASVITKYYENRGLVRRRENKPNQTRRQISLLRKSIVPGRDNSQLVVDNRQFRCYSIADLVNGAKLWN
jgi:hypothetical protein